MLIQGRKFAFTAGRTCRPSCRPIPNGERSWISSTWSNSFFARFTNPDGSAAGGYQPYSGLDDFKTKLAHDLQTILAARIGPAPASGTAAGTQPDAPTVPLPDRCFGRAEDTAKLVVALCAASVPTAVLVQGPGGIGKTTLTQDAANHPDVRAQFGPRRWLVPLETATDRDTFDAALLTAIGLDPAAGFSPAPRRLAQAPTLLVLDNLETPWERAGPAIEARLGELAAIPGVTLLASFRGQEAVGGVHWSLRHRVDPLPDEQASALFRDIADAIPAHDAHLPALLRELGGVPLAICLTARRAARHADLAGLWAEWQRVGVELAQWQGTDPARLTSVAHSIELSLRSPRLRASGHRLFAMLGQLPAGLAPADRDALLGGEAFAAEDGLLAVGLAHHRAGRLDLLPPVRDHARRAHPPTGQDATAWCRHFLTLTREQGGRIFGAGGAEALARLTPEVANLDAALRAATALSLREIAVAAAEGTYRLLSASGAGSITTLRGLGQACLAASDKRGAARCYLYAGVVASDRSDHAGARALYEQARPLYQQAGDVLGEANCIRSLGDIALRRSDHAGAGALYEQARPLYQQVGDVLGEANCIRSLGDIALRRSDHAGAGALYEQARPLYQQVGDVLGEANCIKSLGNIALARSDHAAARALYEQARPLYQQVGDVLGEANCIRSLGDIALRRSDHAGARALYEQARPLYQQVGAVLGEANCIKSLGDIALARSDHAGARALYEQARPLYQQVGDVLGEANCISAMGDVARAEGDAAAARASVHPGVGALRTGSCRAERGARTRGPRPRDGRRGAGGACGGGASGVGVDGPAGAGGAGGAGVRLNGRTGPSPPLHLAAVPAGMIGHSRPGLPIKSHGPRLLRPGGRRTSAATRRPRSPNRWWSPGTANPASSFWPPRNMPAASNSTAASCVWTTSRTPGSSR